LEVIEVDAGVPVFHEDANPQPGCRWDTFSPQAGVKACFVDSVESPLKVKRNERDHF
jgi:hypothetical protein